MKNPRLTIDRLKQFLEYDPNDGAFTWKALSPKNRVLVGQIAGSVKNGYIYIKIDGVDYRAHRLAWFYMTGEWPALSIDHSDLNKTNNSWRNLRQCTLSENQANCRARQTNRSGFKGVSWYSRNNKWRSQIFARGKKIFLGYFERPEKAHEAYIAAAKKYFGDFARPA